MKVTCLKIISAIENLVFNKINSTVVEIQSNLINLKYLKI